VLGGAGGEGGEGGKQELTPVPRSIPACHPAIEGQPGIDVCEEPPDTKKGRVPRREILPIVIGIWRWWLYETRQSRSFAVCLCSGLPNFFVLVIDRKHGNIDKLSVQRVHRLYGSVISKQTETLRDGECIGD
jgi:hypothetical protein